MANNVEFQDFSFQVKAAINDETIAWLHTWGNEIASQAKRNVTMDDATGVQLRGSYASKVDESKGEASVGSPLESAFWEEYGTGSHADTNKNGGKKGRQGWWVYKDGYKGNGGAELTEAEAKAMEAADPTVHATNGRKPSYALEKAFTIVRPKAIANLEQRLGRRLGD